MKSQKTYANSLGMYALTGNVLSLIIGTLAIAFFGLGVLSTVIVERIFCLVFGVMATAMAPILAEMAKSDLAKARSWRKTDNTIIRTKMELEAVGAYQELSSEEQELCLLPQEESNVSFWEAFEEMTTDALRSQYFTTEKEAEIELRLG